MSASFTFVCGRVSLKTVLMRVVCVGMGEGQLKQRLAGAGVGEGILR